jgi:hypothetical protein
MHIIPPANTVVNSGCIWFVQHCEILVSRDFYIVFLSWDQLNRMVHTFNQGSVVRSVPSISNSQGMGLTNDISSKSLRCLDGKQTISVQGLESMAFDSLFYRVCNRQGRNCGHSSRGKGINDLLNQMGPNKGTGCIVDQNVGALWR